MTEFITDSLTAIGLMVVVIAVILCVTYICECITDKIAKIRHKNKIKHRFDKPPTAKCYCVDCVYFQADDKAENNNSVTSEGHCHRLHRWVADNWFCWDATATLREG